MQDMINKIQQGWFEFDVCVATPDMMSEVGKLGRILGGKGLMPNPKAGTVTFDVTKAVQEIKAGKIEYRLDKAGQIHAPIGKVSFDADKLNENFRALIDALVRAKPAAAKGVYLKNIAVSSTMGPSVRVNLSILQISKSYQLTSVVERDTLSKVIKMNMQTVDSRCLTCLISYRGVMIYIAISLYIKEIVNTSCLRSVYEGISYL